MYVHRYYLRIYVYNLPEIFVLTSSLGGPWPNSFTAITMTVTSPFWAPLGSDKTGNACDVVWLKMLNLPTLLITRKFIIFSCKLLKFHVIVHWLIILTRSHCSIVTWTWLMPINSKQHIHVHNYVCTLVYVCMYVCYNSYYAKLQAMYVWFGMYVNSDNYGM